jgi:SAM-dependent methyltransferase
MHPFVETLIERVVRPGDAILDVACGTGFATRAAVAAVGPTGSVAAIDVNPGMVAEARSHPVGHGVPVDWREASALDLPFPTASFDSVICQQGVQFFPDPVAGLTEMRRVLRPNGRAGVTVWAPIDRSPYITAQLALLEAHVGVGLSGANPPCPPGGEAALLDWATRANCPNAHVEAIERLIHLPNLAAHIPNHLAALPWSAPFFALAAEVQAAAITSMMTALAEYVDANGDAAIPTTSLLLTFTADF